MEGISITDLPFIQKYLCPWTFSNKISCLEVQDMDNVKEYLIFFLIWLISTIFFKKISSKPGKQLRLPPSPLAWPIIGHLHLLGAAPHKAIDKLSKKYGPLIHLYLGSTPCLFVSSAEMAKDILKTHEKSFCNRNANIAISYLTYDLSDFAFSPYGPYWKFMKKLCMSELLNGRMLEQLYPIRQEENMRFLQLLVNKADLKEAVDLKSELLRLTRNIVMRMAIGKDFSSSEDHARQLTKFVKLSSELSGAFNLSDYFKFFKNYDLQGFGTRLKHVRDGCDVIWESIIQERQETRKMYKKNAAKDMLDVLLELSEDENSEIKLTKENIKGFFMDIFAGGTDTSAIALDWALAEVINNPNVLEKAKKEIDCMIGSEKIVMESDIPKLPYLQAIVKETLRLHPPGAFLMRESTENCTIAGYDIPEKTRVLVNLWSLGRDPEQWENPLEFCPERFLSEEGCVRNSMDVRGQQQFQYLPFGSGIRGCPGSSLALNMILTTLAALIQCFEWKVGDAVATIDMKEGTAITGGRAGDFICIPVSRLNPFPSLSF